MIPVFLRETVEKFMKKVYHEYIKSIGVDSI